jgi:hypothetical protein
LLLLLQMRSPTTSFADKNSVQRLAGDSLPSQAHVTAFNVQVRWLKHTTWASWGWAKYFTAAAQDLSAHGHKALRHARSAIWCAPVQLFCCCSWHWCLHCSCALCLLCCLQFSQQQGNRCRSVLSFVAKESVDLLIIGLYKANSRRKGLALKGNALALASRCAWQVVAHSAPSVFALTQPVDPTTMKAHT